MGDTQMGKPPLMRSTSAPAQSPTPSPADHVRTLIELLRPAGPDLARRWVAALLMAPVEEREAIVQAVEARMVDLYARGGASANDPADNERWVHLAADPVQRDGFVEQTIRTYGVHDDAQADSAPEVVTRPRRARKAAGE